jgi:hypothetical protein
MTCLWRCENDKSTSKQAEEYLQAEEAEAKARTCKDPMLKRSYEATLLIGGD